MSGRGNILDWDGEMNKAKQSKAKQAAICSCLRVAWNCCCPLRFQKDITSPCTCTYSIYNQIQSNPQKRSLPFIHHSDRAVIAASDVPSSDGTDSYTWTATRNFVSHGWNSLSRPSHPFFKASATKGHRLRGPGLARV
jgi:hypothetical protein